MPSFLSTVVLGLVCASSLVGAFPHSRHHHAAVKRQLIGENPDGSLEVPAPAPVASGIPSEPVSVATPPQPSSTPPAPASPPVGVISTPEPSTPPAAPADPPQPSVASRPVANGNVPQKSGFSLTWSDDFSGPAGALSSSNWQYDTGTSYNGGPSNWGTGEIETYTSSTNNVGLDGQGALYIRPRLVNGVWTSSRLESVRGDFQCQPGKQMIIEASILLPSMDESQQAGVWPAFWAMGQAFRDGGNNGWPGTGEWDILETINGQSTAHGTVHCGTAPGGPCNEYTGISGQTSFQRGVYHTFSILVDRTPGSWEQESMSFQLDGNTYSTVTGSIVGGADAWSKLVHEPMFILFNVAIGGGWPGSPNAQTVEGSGSGMSVDYVAVYNS